MKNFNYVRAGSFQEASELAGKGGKVLAGGTELLDSMKMDILPDYPETVVSMKGIEGADGIEERDGKVVLGALTKLSTVAEDATVAEDVPMLAEAARSVATPLVRNIATIGGNVCQDVRCWFYRYPHEIGGRLMCARKGGDTCYGILGDNRYHSIFGGMKTGLTPCSFECPAGTDIPAYMERIRGGDWDGAAEIIMRYNPLPMLTSRVCAHTCQTKCNQCQNGDAVAIHAVERALGDHILANAKRFYRAPESETGKSVGIVGGGPAGLAAAYYLRGAGHAVTVYDKMDEPGGVLMYGIPEYRLPKKYVRGVVDAIRGMGVEFVTNTEVGKDISVEEIEKANDAMFIDTGAWKQPILGIDGEELTQFGLNFLVEVKQYLTKKIGKEVLVCGGGNVAMDVALSARRLGAKSVTLVCLEQRDEMPASPEEVARAEEEGVRIINGRGLKKVIYEDGRVKGMQTNLCTSVFDAEGHFNPSYDDSDLRVIESDYIILATGQRVDLDFLGEKFKDQVRSARGLIEVDEHKGTRRPGVYAGGDVASGPSVAIKAIRDGGTAARSISGYLGFPIERESHVTGAVHCDPALIHNTTAAREQDTPVEKRTLAVEDSSSLDKAQAAGEAGRCMNCGCYSVNASDITPVLVALGADIVTSRRTIPAAELFTTALRVSDKLEPGEIVTSIEVPVPKGAVMHYDKFRLRSSVDFAMVSLASSYEVKGGKVADARVVFGGVAPVPVRMPEVEEYLKGKPFPLDDAAAQEAADIAMRDATPFERNAYKVQIAKTLLKTSVQRSE